MILKVFLFMPRYPWFFRVFLLLTTTWRSVKLSKENDFYLYLLRFFITLAFTWLTTQKTGTGSGEPLCGLSEKIIVDDISLAIPQQKMTVLVGANGCGKSTLLSTIARLLSRLAARRSRRQGDPRAADQSRRPPAWYPAAVSAAAGRVNRF
jgi:ABC-type multidrug transport system fused ATPase/permease subunit